MAPGEPGPVLKPSDADQVLEVVAWAAAEEAPLEIVAGGTKRGLGRPLQAITPPRVWRPSSPP